MPCVKIPGYVSPTVAMELDLEVPRDRWHMMEAPLRARLILGAYAPERVLRLARVPSWSPPR